jgi:carbamoyltransferase
LERAESRGLPALINTSFNRHQEPIVETPDDAIETFLSTRLDAMQLGGFVVRRPQ